MRRIFKYLENLWIGFDGKPSLRSVLAIMFSVNMMYNISHAIWKWESGKSLEGLSLVLGIEAGLVVSLLGITAWSNMTSKKIDSDAISFSGSTINVQKADTVVSSPTKAENVNAENVNTINSENTNVAAEPADKR